MIIRKLKMVNPSAKDSVNFSIGKKILEEFFLKMDKIKK